MSERKYAIINYTDITDAMIESSMEASRSDMRETRTGVTSPKVIVKWEGRKPSSVYGRDTYSHSQILSILNDPDGDWFIDAELYLSSSL